MARMTTEYVVYNINTGDVVTHPVPREMAESICATNNNPAFAPRYAMRAVEETMMANKLYEVVNETTGDIITHPVSFEMAEKIAATFDDCVFREYETAFEVYNIRTGLKVYGPSSLGFARDYLDIAGDGYAVRNAS